MLLLSLIVPNTHIVMHVSIQHFYLSVNENCILHTYIWYFLACFIVSPLTCFQFDPKVEEYHWKATDIVITKSDFL